jgi:hypothetical protein
MWRAVFRRVTPFASRIPCYTKPAHYSLQAEHAEPAADRASIAYRLPKASIEPLGGLIERVASGPDDGRDDLPKLAEDMQLEVDDLLPLPDAAELLELAEVRSGDISILPAGQAFADGDIQQQKQVFAAQLLQQAPMVAHIQQVLQTRPDHRAPEERFLSELQDFISQEDAEAVLATAIDCGRYARSLPTIRTLAYSRWRQSQRQWAPRRHGRSDVMNTARQCSDCRVQNVIAWATTMLPTLLSAALVVVTVLTVLGVALPQ